MSQPGPLTPFLKPTGHHTRSGPCWELWAPVTRRVAAGSSAPTDHPSSVDRGETEGRWGGGSTCAPCSVSLNRSCPERWGS